MSEFAFINWLQQHTPAAADVLLGPGDDTAVVKPLSRPMLIATDMLVDGTHFALSDTDPKRIGRKAMAVNLSDIAAMAGVPRFAVVSVALPSDSGLQLAEALHTGMREMADEFQTAIVGGDTNSGAMPLTISVTVIGETTQHGEVRRSGAKAGDWLMATGSFGGSLAGRHLDFMPRVREALELHGQVDLHAMIDVSDGLAGDVWHICEESQCGAVLRADAIPISAAARAMNDGRTALQHALHDGEDFELVFAVSPDDGKRLLATQPISGATISHVGEIISEKELFLDSNGQREVLRPEGFVHQFK